MKCEEPTPANYVRLGIHGDKVELYLNEVKVKGVIDSKMSTLFVDL